MSFGQQHYPALQDNNGYIIAVCNIMERFKQPIDPAVFNGTASYLSDNLIVDQTSNEAEWPPTDNAIVTFSRSRLDGHREDFYCAVLDTANHLIIDSEDGLIKTPPDILGQPVGWVSFKQPQVNEPMIYKQNTVDGIHYESYGAPKRMYVKRLNGIDKVSFGGEISTYRDFMGVPDSHEDFNTEIRVMGTAHHPVIPSGRDFYITMEDFGSFTRTGRIASLQGFYTSDLQDTPVETRRASQDVNRVPIRKPEVLPDPPKPIDTSQFNFRWLREDHKPVKYMVMRRVGVTDYRQVGAHQVIPAKQVLSIYGTFQPNNTTTYLLPGIKGTPLFHHWYGVPELDSDGNRNIEEMPDYTEIRKEKEELMSQVPATAIADYRHHKAGKPIHWSDHYVNISTILEVIPVKGIKKIKALMKGKK